MHVDDLFFRFPSSVEKSVMRAEQEAEKVHGGGQKGAEGAEGAEGRILIVG